MKIAAIFRRLDLKGGTQREGLAGLKPLRERGHHITLYTFVYDKEACFPELLEGYTVVTIPNNLYASTTPKNAFGRYLAYFKNLSAENRAAKALAMRIDPSTDLLNPQDHVTYRVAAYYKRLVKNIPSVWVMNDMPTKIGMWIRERELTGIKLPFWKKALYRLIDALDVYRFIKKQDEIVVLDPRDGVWVKQFFKKEAWVNPCGIDPIYFTYYPREPIDKSRPAKLLMSSIFFRHRRFEDGIRALKLLKERGYKATIAIIGHPHDTVYYDETVALVRKLGFERDVFFLGRVSEEELMRHYREDDILLYPNHLQSFGLTPYELMASGMPVVICRTAGSAELLTHEKNALVVDPKSPEQIADAVARLIDDGELYTRLSHDGRSFVETDVSWGKFADTMEAAFARACVRYGVGS